MSFSIYLRSPGWLEIMAVDGQTYNLLPMWRLAMPGLTFVQDLDGKFAYEVSTPALFGLVRAWRSPELFYRVEPANGWGDFDGWLEVYTGFVGELFAAPHAVLQVLG